MHPYLWEQTLEFYELLLWLHITTAVLWAGGNAFLNLQAIRVRTSGNSQELDATIRTAAWFGNRYFAPLSLLTLAFGAWLINETGWTFEDTWIVVSMVGWTASFLLGAAYFGPESNRIVRIFDERGANDAEGRGRAIRLLNIALVDAVILLAIVFLMSVKPWV